MESANAWLDDARHLDPVGVFSTCILKLNGLFEKRRTKYSSMPPDSLPPRVAKRLTRSIESSRDLDVSQHTMTVFQVQAVKNGTERRTVNIQDRSCSCGLYGEYGVPCSHVCAALLSMNNDNFIPFVARERLLESLVATYVGFVVPVDLSHLFNDGLFPPVETKKRGRPKEKRFVSQVEKAPKKTVTCSRCGARGHNVRTCKNRN